MQESQSWINEKVLIKDSPIGGKGMFAKADISAGEKVLEWRGYYTDNEHEANSARNSGQLVKQWDEKLWSIEDRGEDPGYFVNHSCDPNIWMQDATSFVAMRPIKAGEEIVTDYALWETGEYVAKWQCNCGSAECRQRITGDDWKIPALQERYKGHFSPLINNMISKQVS